MASLHTISNCIYNPHRKYRKFCVKQQPEETQSIQECLKIITLCNFTNQHKSIFQIDSKVSLAINLVS